MKNYINQLYNEGLGETLLQKPLNYLKNKIKNNKIYNFIKYFLYVLFTLFILFIVVLIFKWQFPL